MLISAQDTDVPQTTLQLSLYERNKDGRFQAVDTLDFDTPVNRVTKDAEFHLIPQTAQVTLTVDYLTDLNGDGLYELLSSQEAPVCDVLTSSGVLTAASSGVSTTLTAGTTYTLTAASLLKRGQAAHSRPHRQRQRQPPLRHDRRPDRRRLHPLYDHCELPLRPRQRGL